MMKPSLKLDLINSCLQKAPLRRNLTPYTKSAKSGSPLSLPFVHSGLIPAYIEALSLGYTRVTLYSGDRGGVDEHKEVPIICSKANRYFPTLPYPGFLLLINLG